MTDYAKCFDNAVAAIDRRDQFPGQIMPGLWDLNSKGLVPAVIIGVIIADALSEASKACNIPFDFLLARYERLMQGTPLEIVGSPDKIARRQLVKAAALDRLHAHRSGEQAQISLEAAAEATLTYLDGLPGAEAFAVSLRNALESSRKSHA